MKKFLTTILLIVYFFTSMGATVHLHYCMGKLFSWSLTDKDGKSCQCGMLNDSKGGHVISFKGECCQDRYAHIQVDKDQKTSEAVYKFLTPSFVALPVAITTLPDLYVASYIIDYPTTNAPPDPDKVPVFIRNCTFRI